MRIGIYIILLIALIVASITDLKKHEIPTWVFPGSLYLCIFYIAILNEKYFQMDNLIGYLCAAIPVLIACLLDKMGGADLIMFSTIGLILGTQDMLPYVLCLMICGVVVVLLIKDKKKEIAIAPIAGAAYILFLIGKVVLYYV